MRERVDNAETRLRRFTDALASGVDPAALVEPMNAGQADAHAAREQLNALTLPAATPGRVQVEAAFEALQESVGDLLSQDRSPHLLRELYASLWLALTWHHNDRRLVAKLDLTSAQPCPRSPAPTKEVGRPVSEGGLR